MEFRSCSLFVCLMNLARLVSILPIHRSCFFLLGFVRASVWPGYLPISWGWRTSLQGPMLRLGCRQGQVALLCRPALASCALEHVQTSPCRSFLCSFVYDARSPSLPWPQLNTGNRQHVHITFTPPERRTYREFQTRIQRRRERGQKVKKAEKIIPNS